MNIEEAKNHYLELKPCEKWIESIEPSFFFEFAETIITAYEKEKGENVKLRLQDIPLIEGELKAYKDRVNELKAELEKEKEKNKRLTVCHLQYEEMTGIDLLLPSKEK